jgi:hypothetical protein
MLARLASLAYLAYFRDALLLHCILYDIATLLSSPSAILFTLQYKRAFLNSIMVHTPSVRISRFDASSRSNRLLDLLRTDPDPSVRTNRCI